MTLCSQLAKVDGGFHPDRCRHHCQACLQTCVLLLALTKVAALVRARNSQAHVQPQNAVVPECGVALTFHVFLACCLCLCST
jgi:energy-converting hydrogenase Eha subunit E